MKAFPFILITCLVLFACKNEKSQPPPANTDSIEDTSKELKEETLEFSKNNDPILEKWTKYYESIDSDFDLKRFEINSTSKLDKMQGTVAGKFDENFDTVYEDLLIYSPNGESYIDLDSYHWELDEKDVMQFSPDQEINLVNISNKTVERIAFRGPSNTVEDAYWKGNDTVVLLEESYDKVPFISLIDLKNKEIKTYIYPDTLKLRSAYYEQRIQRKIQ